MVLSLQSTQTTTRLLIFRVNPSYQQFEQRWASSLASFNFDIHYRPGRHNRNADALSRLNNDQVADGLAHVSESTTIPTEISNGVQQDKSSETNREASLNDLDLFAISTLSSAWQISAFRLCKPKTTL